MKTENLKLKTAPSHRTLTRMTYISHRILPVAAALAVGFSSAVAADQPVVLKLWPQGAPEKPGFKMDAEKEIPPKNESDVKRVTNVTDPTITVYRPEKPNGTAVIVCPGGGYSILAIEHEGSQVCEYLNTLGVTGILLKYRVPKRDESDPGKEPLQDAQRAFGLAQKHAAEWGIKPDKIGILGFSAGGHLCVNATLHPNDRTYPQDPALDVADATPAFSIPVYPAYLTEKGNDFQLKPEFKVGPTAPPICLIHAHDDKITPAGSALLYLEYKKANLSAELHIFSKGGHGYGMKKGPNPVNEWPQRVGEWLKANSWAN
ncbi:alpha/beta hydrolase [Verrucomicrobium sp. BvORR106]|uniref:alpha/beta hydrolase n=1 Tax=Verrucomicrobium sp. BvORR106 TaxID=1403819 RepID=UPI00068C4313|nr:alpha/beta hydrolase [Verrucomicrobium sp. BvORR106]